MYQFSGKNRGYIGNFVQLQSKFTERRRKDIGEHTWETLILEGEIVTLQVRPLLDSFEMETSTILPTGNVDELPSDFLASLNDKKPETSGIPRLSMYPWSSILLTEADKVYACMSKETMEPGRHYSQSQASGPFLLPLGSLAQE